MIDLKNRGWWVCGWYRYVKVRISVLMFCGELVILCYKILILVKMSFRGYFKKEKIVSGE